MACASYMEVTEFKRKHKPQKITSFHPAGEHMKYCLKLPADISSE